MDSGILTLILSTVIPISAAVAVGYGLVRSGRRLDSESLTVLAADFALPCLVFATIIKAEISWIEFSTMALAGVVSLVLLGVIGGIILRFAGLSLRVYLPSLTSGNSIYIGFPTALYAFGQTGLTQAVAFATGALILNCTVVQALTAGKVNWKEIVRSPLIFAVLLAVLVRWTQAQIPNAVLDTCPCCWAG